MNLLAEEYEYLDPTPDVRSLFQEYDALFFDGLLQGCEIKWSPRMTLCAGLCSFQPATGFCSIRLSQPLLQLRPRSDLVNTLLHEMIHAFLFLHSPMRDHEDHGPQFQYHMHRINNLAQTRITVFHTFHDEVDTYRVHWWKCNGPCQRRPPYFGMVKRAMNRPPGPRDSWWTKHEQECGGTYTKVRDPPLKPRNAHKMERNVAKKVKIGSVERHQPSIAAFFPPHAPQPAQPPVKSMDSMASTDTTAMETPLEPATPLGSAQLCHRSRTAVHPPPTEIQPKDDDVVIIDLTSMSDSD
ncbi:hypothetical protein H310_07429 [Aphanomyces invadans]|uniref:SprT-like domain-containing protein n=1 Tax=Aphanomyces invadans TaxID=157072 RepID=A0A024U161_9STRA|nr:hypothetical protein H310_07429 [Aphanomyces invadans]ETV99978.1 hypothetical protein H310_07429 [Aphanomyces invadans]|eukprot:XP_008871396.1 hypothetical protein H310_07429 [Aphanomyces invadans]